MILRFCYLLLITLISSSGFAQTKGACDASSKKELDKTVTKLISVLKNREVDSFLNLSSKQGIAFGIDYPTMSLATIRKNIEGRKGVYCLLFDSGCLSGEEKKRNVRSLRDYLMQDPSVQGAVGKDHRNCVGNTVGLAKLTRNAFQDIEFTLENGEWKIAAIPYP